jgi:DNA-directed RNA polymerase subunit RPC12/RpoP
MILKIKCPKCGTDGSFSLADNSYEGPYRCWKCRALFTLKMKNNKLISCEPLSQEEFEKQQEIEALRKKISGK